MWHIKHGVPMKQKHENNPSLSRHSGPLPSKLQGPTSLKLKKKPEFRKTHLHSEERWNIRRNFTEWFCAMSSLLQSPPCIYFLFWEDLVSDLQMWMTNTEAKEHNANYTSTVTRYWEVANAHHKHKTQECEPGQFRACASSCRQLRMLWVFSVTVYAGTILNPRIAGVWKMSHIKHGRGCRSMQSS